MQPNADKTIPIVVGVTGHRAIRPEDRGALMAAVREELEKLRALCPNSPLVMLTSLAEGGDLICAEAAEELGVALRVVLPMPREEYEKDFTPAAKERFAAHCARAEQVFVAPAAEAPPEDGRTRDFLFRQAGIYVSAHSHVLLALWDGGPGTKARCGTAEAVDFALNGSYAPLSGVPIRSEGNETVIHIYTPRGDRCAEPAGAVHVLGDSAAVREALTQTDEFNRLAQTQPDGAPLLPEDRPEDGDLLRMEKIYRAASRLSKDSAGRYRRVLALLAAASSVLTFAFLLYDEAGAIWMILVCGAMILAAWLCLRYARRSDCHRRYIEYRVLAESLRVQAFLRYAGSRLCAAELLPWTQQRETAWIMDALCALHIGCLEGEGRSILGCWVEDQQRYHRSAAGRSGQRLRSSERVVNRALLLSIALYFAALIFELCCGGLLFRPVLGVRDVEIYRTLLKIALGSISALTLFIANYYGRLSLPRELSDHEKMEHFYHKMAAQLTKHGQTDRLLTVLAREELIENGNWCSYQRDNKPDLSL